MRVTRHLLGTVAGAVLCSAVPARAWTGVAELGVGAGSVSHAVGVDRPLLPTLTATLGVRALRFRIGLLGRVAVSIQRGPMVETGMAISYDVAAAELDRERTAGFYVRGDFFARFEPGVEPEPDVTVGAIFALGVRVLGVSLQFGGGPVWEPAEERRWGGIIEARLSIDFFELPDLVGVIRALA